MRATDLVYSTDWKGSRYDNLQVTREDITAEKLICRLNTVEPRELMLITEGIADAITAHQAGYPSLSSVMV
jgi:hypothetical protein